MGFLRFVIWTSLCVAFGIAAATVDLGGRTLWQYAQGSWRANEPRLDKVKSDAAGLAQGVKAQVKEQLDHAVVDGPKERHSQEDRAAIEQIIARRGQKEPAPGVRRP